MSENQISFGCSFDNQLLLKQRLFYYLENSPKKCFFSVFNLMSSKESTLIALKNSKELKELIKLYEDNVVSGKQSLEEFKKDYCCGK